MQTEVCIQCLQIRPMLNNLNGTFRSVLQPVYIKATTLGYRNCIKGKMYKCKFQVGPVAQAYVKIYNIYNETAYANRNRPTVDFQRQNQTDLLSQSGYVLFRKDRVNRKGDRVSCLSVCYRMFRSFLRFRHPRLSRFFYLVCFYRASEHWTRY